MPRNGQEAELLHWMLNAIILLLAAGVLGLLYFLYAAMRRQQNIVRALADASRIVENSSTVLFRLEASPAMPMTYASKNISKFGHDAAGLVAGGVLYKTLIHPDDRALFTAALASQLESGAKPGAAEFRLRTGNGTYAWVEARYRAVRNEHGKLREIEGLFLDIAERREATAAEAKLARVDGLTGLANRAVLFERMEQAILACKRGALPFAVHYVDLDHFKDINDFQGHHSGDRLLKLAAERMQAAVRATDLVSRMGGDEFVVLQSNVMDPADAGHLAAKLIQVLAEPFAIENTEIFETASIGIAICTDANISAQDILKQADAALYRAKAEGRARYCFFREGIDVTVRDRVSLSRDLNGAIETGQMALLYQPQVELASGRLLGLEALARWRHPERGVLSPATFLALAEKSSVAEQLARWSIREACRQIKLWQGAGLAVPPVTINLSAGALHRIDDVEQEIRVESSLAGIAVDRLTLEMFESDLAEVDQACLAALGRLRALGIAFAVDGLGAGSLRLERLAAVQPRFLKIDQSHVKAAPIHPLNASVLRAVVAIARALGAEVTAVGVETTAQVKALAEAGCRVGQGFLFSQAIDAEETARLLKAGRVEEVKRHATVVFSAADSAPKPAVPGPSPETGSGDAR
jgi:diguanylate cyclase (GGDEF)-like protein/PAS domain S-box-containing protein